MTLCKISNHELKIQYSYIISMNINESVVQIIVMNIKNHKNVHGHLTYLGNLSSVKEPKEGKTYNFNSGLFSEL